MISCHSALTPSHTSLIDPRRIMSHDSPIYARSMGPAGLAAALDERGSLHTSSEPVTFLMKIPPGTSPHKAAAECDAWHYGCGEEVGIFALLDADDLAVQRTSRPDDHAHFPERSPHHVWIDNASQPLPFERGIYVQSPQELAAIIPSTSMSEAHERLEALRGHDQQSTLEAASQRAHTLARQLEDFGVRQQQLSSLRGNYDQLPELFESLGLPLWLLDVHPEHLDKDLRQALDLIHQSIEV